MRSRSTVRLRPIEPGTAESPPVAAPAAAAGPPPIPASPRSPDRRRHGLRPVTELPPRAKLFLAAALLALVGFAVWVTIRLLQVDGRALAIVLIALSYLGAVVVGAAVVTLTRLAFSLRALPYLLGRGARRLLGRRR